MYTSSRSASYTLPRSSTYISSRYSDTTSSLPPISSKYSSTTSSRYSDSTSSYKSTYSRPTTYLTSSRYTASAPSELTQSWRSTISSPLSSRKSSITNDTTTSGYVSRRPSISTGRSDSITSLASLYSIDTYRPKEPSYRSSFSSSIGKKEDDDEKYVPRSSRVGSISSSGYLSSANSTHGSSYKTSLDIGSRDLNSLASGRIGLNNLGNTCFMNAVLQCLCHTRPLVEYCKRGNFNTDVNHRSPSGGKLIKAFAHLTDALWSNNISGSVSPDQLKREIQRYAPTFSGCEQQDAQELLRFLLQGLHDDINRVSIKSLNRSSENTNSSSPRRASESWRQYRNFEDSQIVDIFAGQLKSTLKCSECGSTSCSFDPFWDLSLPIPGSGSRFTLQQCFRFFTSQETLDGSEKPFCERCKANKRSTKTLEINKFPTILVIHLKRFDSDSRFRNKLNIPIDCPEKNLDLSSFASNDCINSSSWYNLYGVVDHIGSALSGHYIAKCKDINTSEWNEYNDARVSSVTASNVITEKAYLLFYEQQGRRYSRL